MRALFADEVVTREPGRCTHARRNPVPSIFPHHLPGMPVVPGALRTERLGSTAGVGIAAVADAPGPPMRAHLRGATFRRFVLPDEAIDVHAHGRSLEPAFARERCRAQEVRTTTANAERLLSLAPRDAARAHVKNKAQARYRRGHGG